VLFTLTYDVLLSVALLNKNEEFTVAIESETFSRANVTSAPRIDRIEDDIEPIAGRVARDGVTSSPISLL
jgi:hypothetical protein